MCKLSVKLDQNFKIITPLQNNIKTYQVHYVAISAIVSLFWTREGTNWSVFSYLFLLIIGLNLTYV